MAKKTKKKKNKLTVADTGIQSAVEATFAHMAETGELEQICRKEINKAIGNTIGGVFAYGDVRRALEDKIKENAMPVIANLGRDEYTEQLEHLLQNAYAASIATETKNMIGRFASTMAPQPERLTLEDIAHIYGEWCANTIDTDYLEVTLEDRPCYSCVSVRLEIVDDDEDIYRYYPTAKLLLTCDEDQSDDLALAIPLIRARGKHEHTTWNVAQMPQIDFTRANKIELMTAAWARCHTDIDGTQRVFEEDGFETDREPEVASWC